MQISLKKIIWIILGGMVVLALLSAWFQSRRGSRAQQELANTRRSLRAQGFKTDLADFDSTVDAATRARGAALTTFNLPLQLDSAGDQLDLLPAVSDDTAGVLWQQPALKIGSGTFEWADLHAVLDPNREALDDACAAATAGPIGFDLDASHAGVRWGVQLSSLRHLALALNSRAMLELHDGRADEAGTNLLAATRLVTALQPDPPALFHLVRSALATLAFESTWQVLQNDRLPDARLVALQNEWASVNYFTNLAEVEAFALAWAVGDCRQLSRQPPFAAFSLGQLAQQAVEDPAAAYREFKDRMDRVRYHGDEALVDEKKLLLYFQQRALERRQAIQAPTWSVMRAQPGVTNLVPFPAALSEVTDLINRYQRINNRLVVLAAEAEAQRRILLTALALARYHGKYGTYPATLPALSPEFLKTVPVDFMDGRPLRYRRTDDGYFVLYSVGLDCVDNGGKLPAPGTPPLSRGSAAAFVTPLNMDIVWPRPATNHSQMPKAP